jgi:hypothetical protein
MKKPGDEKSRDTVPLNQFCPWDRCSSFSNEYLCKYIEKYRNCLKHQAPRGRGFTKIENRKYGTF